jgi:hypothetical protein
LGNIEEERRKSPKNDKLGDAEIRHLKFMKKTLKNYEAL